MTSELTSETVAVQGGGPREPPDTHADLRNRFGFSTSMFLRLLAVVQAIAFVSFWVQLPGLVGPHGILPAQAFLDALRQAYGASIAWSLPTLCWIFGAGIFLHVLCGLGVFAALAEFAGIAPRASLAVVWVCYLSLLGAGQAFYGFQWDSLLLETTFLAIFVAPRGLRPGWRTIEPSGIAHWLIMWLLFRLMVLSGIVKLSSGDPTWRALTALTFHYETQPLPNPLAWYAHHAPSVLHRASCAAMFAIELAVPFLLFCPRRVRHAAAMILAALQLGIAVTGNFAFFNCLTIVLCLACVDDAAWAWLASLTTTGVRRDRAADFAERPIGPKLALAGRFGAGAVIAYTSLLALTSGAMPSPALAWFTAIERRVAPFETFNNYGLFAVMTTTRPELVFEGSDDGRAWAAYELPYKPGPLERRPPFVAPYQPRLDWQLWFAALGSPGENRWVLSVCEHLLRGTPEVLRLFHTNLFAAKPPRYVRVIRYEYHFTTAAERARTGRWWTRSPLDEYVPPASLR